MTTYKGAAAWRRWRALDLPGVIKIEEAGGHDRCVMVATTRDGRTIARYTRSETPAPHSAYDMIITMEIVMVCPIVGAKLDAMIIAEDAASKAGAQLAAVLRDEDAEEWRAERAREAGMCLGVEAYNDHMGY